MEAIIKINPENQTVSARELYIALGYDETNYTKWHKKNITGNPFSVENEDWVLLVLSTSKQKRGQKAQDFAITTDFAKRLSMMAKTEQGERVRRYFLEMEKVAKQQPTQPPMTLEEMMMHQLKSTIDQQKKMTALEVSHVELEKRVQQVEARSGDVPMEHFAITGYGALCKIPIEASDAIKLANKAKAICKAHGYIIGQTPHPRWGRINTYPKDVLKIVFGEMFPDRILAA